MENPQTQKDQLLEDRNPSETLNYALTKEKEDSRTNNASSTTSIHAQTPRRSGINLNQRTRQQISRRSILPGPQNNNRIPDCWNCGYKFIKRHLDNFPAKNIICSICTKIGYYAKVCRSQMPSRRSETQTQNIQRNNSNYNYNRTEYLNTPQQQTNARCVRNIQQSKSEGDTSCKEEDNETETIDTESTRYLREII